MRTKITGVSTLCISFCIFLKCMAVWYGFDRMPLVTGPDEIWANDPAVAISRGKGLCAPSFREVLGFENVYGNHPPVYILVQAAIKIRKRDAAYA